MSYVSIGHFDQICLQKNQIASFYYVGCSNIIGQTLAVLVFLIITYEVPKKKSDKNFLAITDSATWFYCFQGVLWSLLQFWSSSAHEKGYWELFYIIERHLASFLLLCEIALVQLKPSFILCICVLQFRFRHCYLKVPTKISNALVRWVCRSEVLNTKIAVRHVFGVPWTSTWCLVPFIM